MERQGKGEKASSVRRIATHSQQLSLTETSKSQKTVLLFRISHIWLHTGVLESSIAVTTHQSTPSQSEAATVTCVQTANTSEIDNSETTPVPTSASADM